MSDDDNKTTTSDGTEKKCRCCGHPAMRNVLPTLCAPCWKDPAVEFAKCKHGMSIIKEVA